MFRTISPVLPVVGMAKNIAFWERLGFQNTFLDADSIEQSSYAVVRREEMALHLQSFTEEQNLATQKAAIRIEMTSREELEQLYEEWLPHDFITAKLKDQPWGNYEFGFYAPCGTALFFFVDSA
jgi:hypothetical protein